MSEIIDLVDTNNSVIGATDVETAHAQRQLHRVVGVFLFDSSGDILLQSKTKHEKYDLSVGGHVKRGESYHDAAQREMREELNVNVPLTHLSTFLPKNHKLGHFWAIYLGKLPSNWQFSPTEEVKVIVKMSMQELLSTSKSSPQLFTHGLLNTLPEFNRTNFENKLI